MYLSNCLTSGVNNIIWGNFASIGHEVRFQGGVFSAAFSNIDTNIVGVSGTAGLFLESSVINVNPMLDATFHLMPGSPLIDAGTPLAVPGGLDGDQDARLLDGDADGVACQDMGCDEFNLSNLQVTGDGSLGTNFGFLSSGTAGQTYVLAASLGTGDFALGNYGSILLDLTDLMILADGEAPGSDGFLIPLMPSLVGLTAHFQALLRTPMAGIGSMTQRVDKVLH